MPSKIKTRVAYGRYPALINLANDPVIAQRPPNNNDKYDVGQVWDDETTNTVWFLTSYAAGNPVWTAVNNNGYSGLAYATDATGTVATAFNTIYYLTNAGPNNDTLPAGAAVGTQVWLIDNNAAATGAGIIVHANGGATITDANNQVSTAGGTMSFLNAGVGATPLSIVVQLMCTAAGTEWTVIGSNYPGVAA